MLKNHEIIKLKERTINISLKSDTKKELDKLGSRRDSYDDIVRKLIRSYQQKENNKINKEVNRIISYSKLKRKESTIKINKIKITYSFNLPPKEGLSNYTFNIHYEKIFVNNKLTSKEYITSPIDKINYYAQIIEKIIQSYIDQLFRLEKNNRNRLNLDWWERKFKNMGLSYDAFKKDIEEEFMKLGAI